VDSTGLDWTFSLVEPNWTQSSGFHWTWLDFQSGRVWLDWKSGRVRLDWKSGGFYWTPPDWKSSPVQKLCMVTHQTLSPVESSEIWWNPVKSTGVRPESVGERQDLSSSSNVRPAWLPVTLWTFACSTLLCPTGTDWNPLGTTQNLVTTWNQLQSSCNCLELISFNQYQVP